MSETITSAQGPTDVAGPGRAERLRLTWVAWGILLVLALAVVMLRFQRLSELPPGLSYDEGAHGVDALSVLRGEHAAFFPASHGREGLIVYAIALTTSVLGRTILAVRLPTALASAGTVFAVFWLGRLLFGREWDSGRATPWRGLLVGGVGAGLIAVSLAQTVIGRTAFRVNFLPLLLCLCLGLLWEGWRCRSWQGVALAGACAGLLAYTYIAARFVPFLFLFRGLSFLVPWARSEYGGEMRGWALLSHRFSSLTSRLRAEMPLAGVFVGGGRCSGCADSHLFCPESRPIFLAQRPSIGFPIRWRSGRPSVGFVHKRVGASVDLWHLRRPELEAQLLWTASAECMGSILLLDWRGDGRVAMKTARYSSAASLAGAVVVTGHAVPR